jgi:tetratricopeptide (TPR) repeat protein
MSGLGVDRGMPRSTRRGRARGSLGRLRAVIAAALVAFALASPHVAAAPGALSAAAAAAGRPPECRASGARAFGRGPSVWERARTPTLELYCDRIARGQADLAGHPDASKRAADEADAALPGHAAPKVLRARALLALGMAPEAAAAFTEALALDPRCVEDPAALHAYARALLRAGKRAEALAAYRALAPRAEFIGSATERALALIEAADVSMAVAAGSPPARLDEAVAYLREARLRAPSELAADASLALALALDRAGDHAASDAALSEGARAGARVRAFAFLAAPEDQIAIEALALEPGDKAGAQKKWEAFLAGAGGHGPWAATARARVDGLRRGGGRRVARPQRRAAP